MDLVQASLQLTLNRHLLSLSLAPNTFNHHSQPIQASLLVPLNLILSQLFMTLHILNSMSQHLKVGTAPKITNAHLNERSIKTVRKKNLRSNKVNTVYNDKSIGPRVLKRLFHEIKNILETLMIFINGSR